MAVDLSIKRVPDKLAQRLRDRAAENHRSLQGELMAILQSAVDDSASRTSGAPRSVDGWASSTYGRSSESRVAPRSESALMIREDREGRTFTIRDLHKYVSELGESTPDEATEWIRQGRKSR